MKALRNYFNSNKLAQNFAKLFVGQNLSAVLQVLSMWIIIDTIGNASNGVLIIVQSYCYLVSDLTNMQTANSLIKYLTVSLNEQNLKQAKQYFKLGHLIDLGTGVLALIIGLLFYKVISDFFGWDQKFQTYVYYYLPVVIFRGAITGTASGILMYAERFGLLVNINIAISLFRFSLYLLFWFLKVELLYFLIAELVLELSRGFILSVLSFSVANDLGLNNFWKEKINLKECKEYLAFNFFNGVSLTMDLLLGNVSNLFLSKFLGFEVVSIFRVLERIGAIAQRITIPFEQIFFPQMCQMISENKKDQAIGLFKKFTLIGTPISFVFLVLGLVTYPFWMKYFTPEFDKYFLSTGIFLSFTAFSAITSPIHTLMTALGLVRITSFYTIILNGSYIFLLSYFLTTWGLVGMISLKLIQAVLMVLAKTFSIFKVRKI